MVRFRLSPLAERDIEAILAWTHEHFGERGRLRYEALIVRTIQDVADDPMRPGTLARPELTPGARTYHLRLSRDRIMPATDRVRQPRHFLLYRARPDEPVEIGRVLHDGMDLMRHLPDDYRPEATGEPEADRGVQAEGHRDRDAS
jgi:toxin ParE1/3/4